MNVRLATRMIAALQAVLLVFFAQPLMALQPKTTEAVQGCILQRYQPDASKRSPGQIVSGPRYLIAFRISLPDGEKISRKNLEIYDPNEILKNYMISDDPFPLADGAPFGSLIFIAEKSKNNGVTFVAAFHIPNDGKFSVYVLELDANKPKEEQKTTHEFFGTCEISISDDIVWLNEYFEALKQQPASKP
jgi:hypothetical protein